VRGEWVSGTRAGAEELAPWTVSRVVYRSDFEYRHGGARLSST
jgi:hypothetical protein